VWVPRLVVAVVVVAGWSVYSRDRVAIPNPASVVAELPRVVISSEWWSALGQTARSSAMGIALCVAVGVPVGILLGLSSFAYRSARVTLDVLRSVPAVALLPLLVLLLGVGSTTSSILVFSACVWTVILQACYGVRDIDKVARETLVVFGCTRVQRIRHLVLPSAAPYLVTAMRMVTVTALLVAVSSELLVGIPGVGRLIFLDQYSGDYVAMYAHVAAVSMLGLAVNFALARAERSILAWHPSVRRAPRPDSERR